MAIRTELTREELEGVAAEWGLGVLVDSRGLPEGSINTLYSLNTTTGKWVLRISEGRNAAEIQFETTLLLFLQTQHYPSVHLTPRMDGAAYSQLRGKYACVFRWGAGEHVRKRHWSQEQARDAGRLLARLHVLTEALPATLPNRYSPAVVRRWVEELSAEARQPNRPEDPEVWAALPMLEQEAAALDHLPSAAEGIIHADYFPDNLLFVGDRAATVLDFEMACRGPYVLDLATAIHACCYGDDDYSVPRLRAMVEGYRTQREPSRAEWEAFHAWARFSALRFAVSRIRDFHRSTLGAEKLQKKDWRRFRDRLSRTIALGPDGFLKLCGVSLKH